MKAWLATLVALVGVLLLAAALVWWQWSRPWQAWQDFSTAFVQADGRVVDRTAGARSTSEGQAYGLFFALVANDRPAFERILRWTVDNLCAGDARQRLPAWLWGEKDDGSWGVKDPNPASDADLWMAYSLLEAGRLWQQPEWRETGRSLLKRVQAEEVAEIPGVGAMLLPAPVGFQLEAGIWRLNPSYLPGFQFRYFATVDPTGPWQAIWDNHLRLMARLLRRGLAPDWVQVDPSGEPGRDAVSAGMGSYDAIRVYLWAGISEASGGRPEDQALLRQLAPYAALIRNRQTPPERVDSESGLASGGAPIGFSAAVLPFLARLHEDTETVQRQRLKISRQNGVGGHLQEPGSAPHYYDQVLALFGEGWGESLASGRYQFDSDGRLIPRWSKTCCDWPF